MLGFINSTSGIGSPRPAEFAISLRLVVDGEKIGSNVRHDAAIVSLVVHVAPIKRRRIDFAHSAENKHRWADVHVCKHIMGGVFFHFNNRCRRIPCIYLINGSI